MTVVRQIMQTVLSTIVAQQNRGSTLFVVGLARLAPVDRTQPAQFVHASLWMRAGLQDRAWPVIMILVAVGKHSVEPTTAFDYNYNSN